MDGSDGPTHQSFPAVRQVLHSIFEIRTNVSNPESQVSLLWILLRLFISLLDRVGFGKPGNKADFFPDASWALTQTFLFTNRQLWARDTRIPERDLTAFALFQSNSRHSV